jgi:hypothetical protein
MAAHTYTYMQRERESSRRDRWCAYKGCGAAILLEIPRLRQLREHLGPFEYQRREKLFDLHEITSSLFCISAALSLAAAAPDMRIITTAQGCNSASKLSKRARTPSLIPKSSECVCDCRNLSVRWPPGKRGAKRSSPNAR